MAQAHRLDGIVLLGSCDKIVPGMLMAAARLDIPAILLVGGPAEGGCQFDGRAADTTSIAEGLGMLKAGRIDEATYNQLENGVMPTCGSCSFLGTPHPANNIRAAIQIKMLLPFFITYRPFRVHSFASQRLLSTTCHDMSSSITFA